MAKESKITSAEFKRLLGTRLRDPQTKTEDFIALAKMWLTQRREQGRRRPQASRLREVEEFEAAVTLAEKFSRLRGATHLDEEPESEELEEYSTMRGLG